MPINQYDAVTQFHELAGQPVRTAPVEPTIKEIRFRLHFMLEEFIEGVQAICKDGSENALELIHTLKQAQTLSNALEEHDIQVDFNELADSLTDQAYVINGTALYFGIKLPECFDECHEKNLTRFPANQLDLKATLEKAAKEGVEVEANWSEKHKVWAVIRKDNGKLYKNANYVVPDFTPILNQGQ